MEFSYIYQKLDALRMEAIEGLKDKNLTVTARSSLLARKRETDEALACLRLCERHGISSSSRVMTLPEKSTATVLSEYRLIEDQETEDRARWTEVRIEGQSVRPVPGSIIVEPA